MRREKEMNKVYHELSLGMGEGENGLCNIVCPIADDDILKLLLLLLLLLIKLCVNIWFGKFIVDAVEDAVVVIVNRSVFNLVGELTRIRNGDNGVLDCSRFGDKLLFDDDEGDEVAPTRIPGICGCGLRIGTGVIGRCAKPMGGECVLSGGEWFPKR